MRSICPELDARLSAELDRYYFSTDGSGLNLDRWEKHRVINALHRLWNIEEIACYGVGFATEDIRKVILDLMKPAHIRLALKTVDFNSGAAYSLWLGCAIFMFAKFDEDLQHEIRKGILSRGYLPLVVAGLQNMSGIQETTFMPKITRKTGKCEDLCEGRFSSRRKGVRQKRSPESHRRAEPSVFRVF